MSAKFHPNINFEVRQTVLCFGVHFTSACKSFFSRTRKESIWWIRLRVSTRSNSSCSSHSMGSLQEKVMIFVKSAAVGICYTVLMVLQRLTLMVPMISLLNSSIFIIIVYKMQAVGGQVLFALAIPFFSLTALAIYAWPDIKAFFRNQLSTNVRIEENEDERERRQHHIDDAVCSICLSQPKELEVSSTCSHSFCAQCILSLYQHNNEQIKCPLCRQGINMLFKLFQSRQETREVQDRLKQYNILFDDNRPWLRKIIQFPYVLKRLWKSFFSITFLVFFLRSVQIARWLFVIIFYVLLPFDLLPEQVLGIMGYIDDLLLILFIITFLLTIAAIQYYRYHRQ